MGDRLEKALKAEVDELDHMLVHPTSDLRKTVLLEQKAPGHSMQA